MLIPAGADKYYGAGDWGFNPATGLMLIPAIWQRKAAEFRELF